MASDNPQTTTAYTLMWHPTCEGIPIAIYQGDRLIAQLKGIDMRPTIEEARIMTEALNAKQN